MEPVSFQSTRERKCDPKCLFREIFGQEAVLDYQPQIAEKASVAASFKRRHIDNATAQVGVSDSGRAVAQAGASDSDRAVAQVGPSERAV